MNKSQNIAFTNLRRLQFPSCINQLCVRCKVWKMIFKSWPIKVVKFLKMCRVICLIFFLVFSCISVNIYSLTPCCSAVQLFRLTRNSFSYTYGFLFFIFFRRAFRFLNFDISYLQKIGLVNFNTKKYHSLLTLIQISNIYFSAFCTVDYYTDGLFTRSFHLKCIRLVSVHSVTPHLKCIRLVSVRSNLLYIRRANTTDHYYNAFAALLLQGKLLIHQ